VLAEDMQGAMKEWEAPLHRYGFEPVVEQADNLGQDGPQHDLALEMPPRDVRHAPLLTDRLSRPFTRQVCNGLAVMHDVEAPMQGRWSSSWLASARPGF